MTTSTPITTAELNQAFSGFEAAYGYAKALATRAAYQLEDALRENTELRARIAYLTREIGVTEPTDTLTGTTPLGLNPWNGDYTCKPGETVEGLYITGHVILAPNATVRRCMIVGRPLGGKYWPALVYGDNATDATVEDCTIRPTPQAARVSLNGVGWNREGYTVRWCNISGVTDYFHGTGPNMTIQANYGHHYRFDPVDPDQAGEWVHPDAVQHFGGAGLTVAGNAFWMTPDPTLSVNLDQLTANPWYPRDTYYGNHITITLNTRATDFTIANNWMYGGEVAFQMPKRGKGADTGNVGQIYGNRVSITTAAPWHGSAQVHHFRQDPGTGLITTRPDTPNVYLDGPKTGQPLPGTYNPLNVKTAVK